MTYDAIGFFYDTFNENFDHGDYLNKICKTCNFPGNLALDCGCGTGSLMLELCRRGYDCTGVDQADSMLAVAREKLAAEGFDAHLVCQDLPEIDLYGAYHAVFCSLDTVNHILDKRSLKRFFRRLYNFTEPEGLFVFDIKTKELFRQSAELTVCEHDDATFLMQGHFDGTFACYGLTLFQQTENGFFEKTEAEVEERWYDPNELKQMLTDAGFSYQKKIPYQNRLIFVYKKDKVNG